MGARGMEGPEGHSLSIGLMTILRATWGGLGGRNHASRDRWELSEWRYLAPTISFSADLPAVPQCPPAGEEEAIMEPRTQRVLILGEGSCLSPPIMEGQD